MILVRHGANRPRTPLFDGKPKPSDVGEFSNLTTESFSYLRVTIILFSSPHRRNVKQISLSAKFGIHIELLSNLRKCWAKRRVTPPLLIEFKKHRVRPYEEVFPF